MSVDETQTATFESSSRAVLALLQERTDFDLWMVTKTVEEDWTVLYTENRGYDIDEGTVLRWSDSFCSRMIDGQGPRVAPEADGVACYANAAIRQQVSIGSYIGVPVSYVVRYAVCDRPETPACIHKL